MTETCPFMYAAELIRLMTRCRCNNANHDWNSSNQDIHSFTYDCPSGHSKDFCNGYTDGYGDEANDILG